MNRLTLDNFLFISDMELSQYKILAKLQLYKEDFKNNKIFPALNELNDLVYILKKAVKKRSLIIDMFPFPVKKVDVERKCLIFENYEMHNSEVERIFDLFRWAIPVIENMLEEGLCVKKNNSVEEVGTYSY